MMPSPSLWADPLWGFLQYYSTIHCATILRPGDPGYIGDVASCASKQFADDLWFWSFVGGNTADQGLIWNDNGGMNQSNAVDATLSYGALTDGKLPDAPTEIQERANLTFSLSRPRCTHRSTRRSTRLLRWWSRC